MKMYSLYIINNVFNDLYGKKQLLVMVELLQSKMLNCQIKINSYRNNILWTIIHFSAIQIKYYTFRQS